MSEGQIRTPHPDERWSDDWPAGQHGVVARRQLLAAGLTSSMLRSRRGERPSRHPPPWRLRRRARAAAAPRPLARRGPGGRATEAGAEPPRAAAALHGAPTASRHADRCLHRGGAQARRRRPRRRPTHARPPTTSRPSQGIPVTTTVARTLVDLADVLPRRRLSKVDRARPSGSTALRPCTSIEEAIGPGTRPQGPWRGGRSEPPSRDCPGTRHQHSPPHDLEDRFLALLDAHRPPPPRDERAWSRAMQIRRACGPTQRLRRRARRLVSSTATKPAFQHDRTKRKRPRRPRAMPSCASPTTTSRDGRARRRRVRALSRAVGSARPPRRAARPAS